MELQAEVISNKFEIMANKLSKQNILNNIYCYYFDYFCYNIWLTITFGYNIWLTFCYNIAIN